MTAQTILPANTLSSGYDVANSCIFDRASTDNMTKSMSDGSSIKGTFSAWIKVDGTGNEMNILSHFQDTNNVFTISTTGSGVNVVDYNSGYSLQLSTNRLMRDPSAWFHLYIAIDRSQGTANNRNRMFINGVEETSFSHRTNYSQQTSGSHQDAISMNDGDCTMYLGGLGDGNQMFGGYLAELHWIDGTVPAVTEFGEFDEDSEIWKPKLVSGISYGTNGFYLDFQDASNLGNDANGGTDLTENNIVAVNQSTDTCTNNFATMNPLDNYRQAHAFSDGNLTVTTTNGSQSYSTSSILLTSGKWYVECKPVSGGSEPEIGIANKMVLLNAGNNAQVSYNANGYGYRASDPGTVWYNGEYVTNSLVTYANGDIIGIALDLDNNKLYFSKNGTFANSQDPTDGTNAVSIIDPASTEIGGYVFSCNETFNDQNKVFSWNFGSPPYAISSGNTDGNGHGNFEYAVPSGYLALCTKNLAEFG